MALFERPEGLSMAQSLLERRRIEAQFAKAIFDVLAGQRREPPDKMAPDDPAGLLAYAEILALWQQDGALTIDLKVKERDRLEFDVKRCRYAEMYRELGMADLGRILSCNRDGAFCTGFNPAIRLTRTQTIMEGADCCDFRYAMTKGTCTPKDA
jgi:hypothetical protein